MSEWGDDSVSVDELFARFQSERSEAAMEGLVARLLRPAMAAARHILSEEALAEDAVQETFLRLVRETRRYDPRKPFSRWFYTILRNVCRDILRRLAKSASVPEGRLHPHAESGPPTRGTGRADHLLERLGRDERAVLLLRIQASMSFEEIGAALGISVDAAKKRAQRGLRRLREKIHVPAGRAGAYWK